MDRSAITLAAVALTATALLSPGCTPRTADGPSVAAPLLPRQVRLHPFTGARTFDLAGSVKGVEARVEVVNHLGEPTNAFGRFLFLLYDWRAHEADPRGARLDAWQIELTDPDVNLRYWDSLSRTYRFPLVLRQAMPVGRRAVLDVYFHDPAQPDRTPRLHDRLVFTSGE